MVDCTILLVEDDAYIRDELSLFLRRFSKKGLYIAKDGEEGLELFLTHRPEIVISDIKMPKMTGVEMVRLIKERVPDQAVILTSAYSETSYYLEAIELQVDGYFPKPIELKLLKDKIKKISDDILLHRQYEAQKIIINEIAHLQNSMLAVFDEAYTLIFMNDTGLAFWGEESLESIIENNRMLGSRMVKVEGYFYPKNIESRDWLQEIQKLDLHKRMISLRSMQDNRNRAYMVEVSFSEKTGHTIVVLTEVTKIEEEKELYRKRMYIDDLTQINNRAMFEKQIEIEVKEALSHDDSLSVIMLDIDHFKEVNDVYGHLVGDDVLIEMSHLIKKSIRTRDFFARWGGEEFILLLPGTDGEGARFLAENLRKRIETHVFSQDISLTCSFGIASLDASDKLSIFEKVDLALYSAKKEGRNRVSTYE